MLQEQVVLLVILIAVVLKDSDKHYSAVAATIEEGRKFAEDDWTCFQEIDGVKVFREPM